MSSRYPQPFPLPAISPAWFRAFIENTHDLVLVLDNNDVIVGTFQNDSFNQIDVHYWLGLPLVGIVGLESIAKVSFLYADDAAIVGSKARWRHINLNGARGESIPVLAKYFVMSEDEQEIRMLVLRDLRPIQRTNERFIAAYQEAESVFLKKYQQLAKKHNEYKKQLPRALYSDDRLIQEMKNSSFTTVISETVKALEKQCLEVILKEAGGVHEKAATTVGLSLKEWLVKAAEYGLK